MLAESPRVRLACLFLKRPGGGKSLRPDVQGPQGRGGSFLASVFLSCVWGCVHVWFSHASRVSLDKHAQTCFSFPFFSRHQVMDERSDMDRGLEVGGGANGATPVDDPSSEGLGIPP